MKQSIKRLAIVVVSLLVSIMAFAQKVTVTGTVTDQTGQPVIGAGIFEKGTTNGVSTDVDGKYVIAVNQGATLTYSCVGYADAQQKVTGPGELNITLADDTTLLEETVVIGYGVQKKSDVTGAIASIGKDALQNRSLSDVASALSGKTAGVQVISTTGKPGEIGTIRVRGLSSNNAGSSNPLYIVDGLQVSSLATVDPANVESMEILKDAASAAIYGAQAGNGVVLITTKTGKKGEGKIFYDGSYTMESLGYRPTMMNASQYIDYMTTAGAFTQTLVDEYWDKKTDTDWFKEALPGGYAQRHVVGAQGANDKGSYYTSLSLVDHDGILYGDKDIFKRMSFQLNADYKVKSWLKLGTTNTFTRRKTRYMAASHQGDGSIMARVYSMDPLTPMLYEEGNLPEYLKDAIAQGLPVQMTDDGKYMSSTQFVARTQNPLFGVYRYADGGTENYALTGTMYANLTPVKGLTLTSRLGYTFTAYDQTYYTEPYWISGTQFDNNYDLYDKMGFGLKYQWENFANYNVTIAKKHNLDAMVGMSYIEDNQKYLVAQTNELKDYADNFHYITFYKEDASVRKMEGHPSRKANMSYFGRLGYNYDNRYFIQASFRADAFDSSYLAASNRWGYFPSISLGWNVTNEPFMQNVSKDVLSFLKVRASYGTNGNIAALGSYWYDATVKIGASNYQMDNSGNITLATYPTSASNAGLKWETSKQLDLGIDARFLRDRLTIGIDYYNKNTDDLISKVTPSYTTGQSEVYMNVGSVNNSGIEIEASWKDVIGDFSYGISGNISHNANMVTSLNPVLRPRINGVFVSNNHYATAFEIDKSIWYMRGFQYEGFDENGQPQFKDIDGNDKIDEADQTEIGSPLPDFTYGITLTAGWKGIDLSIFGSGSQGNDVWFGMLRSDTPDRNLPSVFYTDSWNKAGAGARYPAIGTTVNTYYYRSSGCIYDGSYFKINQIQLGYSFPKSLIEKAKLSNLRVYASLDDYFTFTKYVGFDPASASTNNGNGMGIDVGTYPSARKLMFGVNISF